MQISDGAKMEITGKSLDPKFLLTSVSPYHLLRGAELGGVINQFVGAAANFDAYCVECGETSTFSVQPTKEYTYGQSVMPQSFGVAPQVPNYGIFVRKYYCARKATHTITIVLEYSTAGITKIGQSPSMSDLAGHNRKRLIAELGDKAVASEFVQSSVLYGHGFGVAAVVYVRRVLEHVVRVAERDLISDGKSLAYDPKVAKFRDRIAALGDYLPESLVANAHAYSLLSEGVHNLSDADCVAIYPALESAVAMFVTEHEARRAKRDATKQIATQLASVAHLIKVAGDPDPK